MREPKYPFRVSEDSVERQTTPERGLLAAILERAVRDLSPIVEVDARRHAIVWFTSTVPCIDCFPDDEDQRFTFARVVELLSLGQGQVDEIMRRVHVAEKFEEKRIQEKREEENKQLRKR